MKKIEKSLKQILKHIGDNPKREGLKQTPKRMIKSWQTLFSGYSINPKSVIKTFKDGVCNEIITLRNIEFYSMCEHHFLPFFGHISIGYLPYKKIIGLSKLARIVEIYARRLQIQERMTSEIADLIQNELEPQGVIVICKSKHLCMVARGVNKQNGEMVTSAVRGLFLTNPPARDEFFRTLEL
jgi:GTP cyclohydrolase I